MEHPNVSVSLRRCRFRLRQCAHGFRLNTKANAKAKANFSFVFIATLNSYLKFACAQCKQPYRVRRRVYNMQHCRTYDTHACWRYLDTTSHDQRARRWRQAVWSRATSRVQSTKRCFRYGPYSRNPRGADPKFTSVNGFQDVQVKTVITEYTRKHSSGMRTARLLTRKGVPLGYTPSRHPPFMEPPSCNTPFMGGNKWRHMCTAICPRNYSPKFVLLYNIGKSTYFWPFHHKIAWEDLCD